MNINNSKKRLNYIKYVILFSLIGGVVGGAFLIFSYVSKKDNKIKNTYQQLMDVSNSKNDQINSYFKEVKNETDYLANLNETRDLLKQPKVIDENIVRMNVDQKAKIIAKEVENYLKRHPKKTFAELKNDSIFQNFAVQVIGLDGYSAVENFEEQALSFQKNNKFIGARYENLAFNSPELFKKLSEQINNPDISEFYNWKETNGKIRRKYIHLIHVEAKTGDGTSLTVVTTAYVDDYKIVKENVNLNTDFLNKVTYKDDFNNLLLIDIDGNLIYERNIKEGIGTNLNWPVNQELDLAKSFIRIKKENKNIFSDTYLDNYGEVYPKFINMSPVYDQGKLLGYVALIKDMSVIFEITRDPKNLGQTGESYLVNSDQKLLISPLRYHSFDMFAQNINTDIVNNCFTNKANTSDFLINYNGDQTMAVYAPISEAPWCLITEMNKNEILNISSNKEWLVLIGIIFIFNFIGFLIAIKINKKALKEEKIKKISKTGNYLSKLKMKNIIIFSLILSICYFFIVTSFFQGWRGAAVYDEISDGFTIWVLLILFFYGFKLNDVKTRKLIIIGALLVIINKAIQIVVEEYIYKFGLVSAYYWIPEDVVGFIGLFFIFYGFKKEINK